MSRRALLLAGLLVYGCGGSGLVGERFDPQHYLVVPGDTLYSIAWRYQLDHRDLIRWNDIASPFTIYPGQRIVLRAQDRTVSEAQTGRGQTALLRLPQPPTVPASAAAPVAAQATTANTAPSSAEPSPRSVKPAAKPSPRAPSAGRWLWPTRGRVVERFDARAKRSLGIDIAGREGQSVRAAAAGRIVYSGSGIPRYGRLVIVKHDEAYLSAYAHNRRLLVAEGADVAAGQVIAEMGRDDDDRVRLHFEIRRDGKPVDPLRYLPR